MKKLKIQKDHLIHLLDVCSLAVNRRDEEDITTNFFFKVSDGILTIFATDKISIAKISTDQIESDSNFSFTLRATKIQGLLTTLKKVDDISLEFNETELNIIINKKYDLPSLDPTNFPFFEDELTKAESISSVEIDKFNDSLHYIKGFIGSDPQARPELTLAPIQKGKLIASNGKTLGVYESDAFKNEGFEISYNVISGIQKFLKYASSKSLLILPDETEDIKETMEETETSNNVDLSDVIESSEKEEKGLEKKVEEKNNTLDIAEVELLKSESYFLLASKDKTSFFGYRKSDYKFPQKMLDTDLDDDYENIIKISRTEILDTISRLSYCLNEKSHRMSFKIEGDEDEPRLVISVLGSHNRESKEEIQISRIKGNDNIEFDLIYLHLVRILPLYISPEITIAIKTDKKLKIMDNMDNLVKLSGMVSFVRKR